MSADPWKDWIPGALNDEQLRVLIEGGYIENAADCSIDYSSMDLRLGSEVYEMLEGSVKPQGRHYERFLRAESRFSKPMHIAPGAEIVLEPRKTYVFKLKERLSTKLKGSNIHGQATAKSSVGRVDVLARLIVDGMHSYEGFDEKVWDGGKGAMFLEVTPITFRVRVREGRSLSQLRLFYGDPELSIIRGKELFQAVMLTGGEFQPDEFLRVDLSNVSFGRRRGVAFKAKKNQNPVNLWLEKDERGKPIHRVNPEPYWQLVGSEQGRFKVTESNFYILRSKEKINLPRGICVYCRAIDETIGEMRIHYAGFAHPYFGFPTEPEQAPGTPLIFEVRGHNVDVVLNDNERLARLQFYRMSQDCSYPPDRKKLSPYSGQTLKLSQFFDEYPISS